MIRRVIVMFGVLAIMAVASLVTAYADEGERTQHPPSVRQAHDHLTDHNWQLEIEGVTQGAFAEVSGLDSETEVIE